MSEPTRTITPRLTDALSEVVRYLDDRAAALRLSSIGNVPDPTLVRVEAVRAELLEAFEEARDATA